VRETPRVAGSPRPCAIDPRRFSRIVSSRARPRWPRGCGSARWRRRARPRCTAGRSATSPTRSPARARRATGWGLGEDLHRAAELHEGALGRGSPSGCRRRPLPLHRQRRRALVHRLPGGADARIRPSPRSAGAWGLTCGLVVISVALRGPGSQVARAYADERGRRTDLLGFEHDGRHGDGGAGADGSPGVAGLGLRRRNDGPPIRALSTGLQRLLSRERDALSGHSGWSTAVAQRATADPRPIDG
jgi:hypothetical protein